MRQPRRARSRSCACALISLAAAASAASAAPPIRAAHYSGALRAPQSKVSISFAVSPAGDRVTSLRIGMLPFYCANGPGPSATPRLTFPQAVISRRGTFSAAGQDRVASGPLKGVPLAKVLVTGAFAAGGRESGTVTTTYPGAAQRCSGHSAYATRG